MDKFLSYLIVMSLALLAVAIAYRVRVLHRLVFGRNSAALLHATDVHLQGAKA